MEQTMLRLGTFKFRISTATFNELTRHWQWRWQAMQRVNHNDLLQYVGENAPKISLKGEVLTTFKDVGTDQIKTLAKQADQHRPLEMHSGYGTSLGYWCVTSIQEVNSSFISGGQPRRQSFELEMVYYGDNIQDA